MPSASLNAIRAVLFDLDGTLYAQLPLRFAMACEIALVCTATAAWGGARIPRVLRTFRSLREDLRHDGHTTEPLAVRQYSVVAERLGCPRRDVQRIVEEWMYRRPLKWLSYCRRPGLVELLRLLESRGIRKGVLSDYPAHDKIDALGLTGQFDVVLSAVDPDVGAFKPDPRGFLAAAGKWGLEPSRVLYVGDRADVDATGARAAGMPCAILTREPSVGPDGIAIRDFAALRTLLEQAG